MKKKFDRKRCHKGLVAHLFRPGQRKPVCRFEPSGSFPGRAEQWEDADDELATCPHCDYEKHAPPWRAVRNSNGEWRVAFGRRRWHATDQKHAEKMAAFLNDCDIIPMPKSRLPFADFK